MGLVHTMVGQYARSSRFQFKESVKDLGTHAYRLSISIWQLNLNKGFQPVEKYVDFSKDGYKNRQ